MWDSLASIFTLDWINYGWVIGAPLMLIGLFFAIFPPLPGNLVILLGCAICGWMNHANHPIAWWTWVILCVLNIGALFLENLSSMAGARRFQASKAGIWGALIGSIVFAIANIFIPIPGVIFLGPFVGTLVGEWLIMRRSIKEGLNSGVGSILGVIAGIFIKGGLGLISIFGFIIAYAY